MMRSAVRGLVPVFVVAAVLAGCSSPSGDAGTVEPEPVADSGTGTAAGKGSDKAVAKGGTVGGSGSACVLPIAFDLAADWKPKAVTFDPGSEIDVLMAKQGPVVLACEIDAKPAGNIGFLRVWTGDASDSTPRGILEGFMAGQQNAGKITYKETEAGAVPAAEVGYTVSGELLDEPKTERAFAVVTPAGPVVVHLGGLDTQEHEEMLPAYELAKKSVRLG